MHREFAARSNYGETMTSATSVRTLVAMCSAMLVHANLEAQGVIAGVAKDEHTGAALSCIDVAMTNARGDTVARTRTFDGGSFQFSAPPHGMYRLHFISWGTYPVTTAPDSLGPTSYREVEHRLRLSLAADTTRLGYVYLDRAASAPPQLRNRGLLPEYPLARKRNGEEGTVVVRYLVDALGVLQPSSMETLASSHRSFALSVEAFLRAAEFSPGRRNHEPVCDLVTQQIDFRLVR